MLNFDLFIGVSHDFGAFADYFFSLIFVINALIKDFRMDNKGKMQTRSVSWTQRKTYFCVVTLSFYGFFDVSLVSCHL